MKPPSFIGIIFEFDDLHTLHGVVVLPFIKRHGGDKLHVPPFCRVHVHDLLLLGIG